MCRARPILGLAEFLLGIIECMGKFGRLSRRLIIALFVCVAVALYAAFTPGGQPEGVGSAVMVLLCFIVGLIFWGLSLVYAILSVRRQELYAYQTLRLNIVGVVIAVVLFWVSAKPWT